MKISVVIPVFNAEKYLRKCLDSVCEQTYQEWEAICIDDGSYDNSYKILQEYAVRDSRFIVETKANEGPGLTRNRALDKASGDYVVFLDSDDYIEVDYFSSVVDRVKITNAEVVFIDVIQEDTNGKVIKYEKMSRFKDLSRKDLIGCQMTGYMPWGGCRKAASRQLIERQHLRYTEDTVGEEAIFSFELLRHANNVVFIEKPFYHYINHPGSQSKNPNGTWEITLKKMEAHLKKNRILEEYNDALGSFAFAVLILWLLNFTKKKPIIKSLKEFEIKIYKFKKRYGWNIKMKYLRWELKLIHLLLSLKINIFLVIGAKIKTCHEITNI